MLFCAAAVRCAWPQAGNAAGAASSSLDVGESSKLVQRVTAATMAALAGAKWRQMTMPTVLRLPRQFVVKATARYAVAPTLAAWQLGSANTCCHLSCHVCIMYVLSTCTQQAKLKSHAVNHHSTVIMYPAMPLTLICAQVKCVNR